MEKGSFQTGPFSRDSRDLRAFRDSREPPACGQNKEKPTIFQQFKIFERF